MKTGRREISLTKSKPKQEQTFTLHEQFSRAVAWLPFTGQNELICFERDNDLLKQAVIGLFLTLQKKIISSSAESSRQGAFVRINSGTPFSRGSTYIFHRGHECSILHVCNKIQIINKS